MRLIDLDDPVVVYVGTHGDYENYNIPIDMPAVEIVQCKDCKFMRQAPLTKDGECVTNACGWHNSFVNEDDYCSRAERSKPDGKS